MKTKRSRTELFRDITSVQAQAIARIVKVTGCVVTPKEFASGKAFSPGTIIVIAKLEPEAYIEVETRIEAADTEFETSGLPWPGAKLV